MKNRPIHENLDTSYVNLSALVKYLRRRQFAGHIRFELSGYEADIVLTGGGQMKVREHDRIAGRTGEGEEALQRILIRAREPGGTINVYHADPAEPVLEKAAVVAESRGPVLEARAAANVERVSPPAPKPAPAPAPAVRFVENAAVAAAVPKSAPPPKPQPAVAATPAPTLRKPAPKPNPKLNNLPFELTNRVEEKARKLSLSESEWTDLTQLMTELLETVDKCLAMAKLDFPSAFSKACSELYGDYPFLRTLEYRAGCLTIDERPGAKLLVASVLEALRRILEKLGGNPKFAEVHRYTSQRMLGLAHRHKPLYDKYSISRPLERMLGV